MPVTLNKSIALADFTALAALANSKLLPIVNASVAAGTWPQHEYSDLTSGALTNPQPAYTFDIAATNWMSELNRIRRDFYNLLDNVISGGSAVYRSQNAVVSGPWVVDVNDPDTFPRTLVDLALPTAQSLNGVFIGSGDGSPGYASYSPCYFRDIAFWFAQNDAPLDDMSITGQTAIGSSVIPITATPVSSFTSPTRKFTVTLNAAAAGTVKLHMEFDFRITSTLTSDPGTAPTIAALNIQKSTGCTGTTTLKSFTHANDGAGFFICNAIYSFTGDWSFSAASGANSVWMSFDVPSAYLAGSSVYHGLNSDASVWASKDFDFVTGSVDAPGINPWSATRKMQCTVNGYDNLSIQAGASQWYGIAQWGLSSPLVKGVWTAKTLPVPGLNVYLDQDLPPYVSVLATQDPTPPGWIIAMTNAWISGPHVSTMRQKATAYIPNPSYIHGVTDQYVPDPNFTAVSSSMAARPAPYQVLRDTDFVPYDLGYSPEVSLVTNSQQIATADGTLQYYDLTVPTKATNIKIRAVQSGTARLGWNGGVFQYGEPISSPVTIYVRASGYPTPTVYDIKKTNSQVTINPDGGGSYLSGILGGSIQYAMQAPSGVDVPFDLVTEIDLASSPYTDRPPARQYFPSRFFNGSGYDIVRESFSLNLADVPANQVSSYGTVGGDNKRIPQNGYSIFKLRATRIPLPNISGVYITPSSGPELSIQIGQNRINADNTLTFVPIYILNAETGAGDSGIGSGDDGMGAGGVDPTPYSIRIPADARDSGDVDVFWPVLAGTELVYKCSEPAIVEAWANWQPAFFNAAMGMGLSTATDSLATPPAPTHFKNALSFVNQFKNYLAGYPSGANFVTSKVQFPMSIEIYNDLEKCLNLL